ncbi:unnamed protein product, partial [Discosporangium mesarthrocarpum]
VPRAAAVIVWLLMPLSSTVFAQDDWELKRDEQGVRVFSREVADARFDEIRVETVVRNSSLDAVVAVLRDTPSNPEWVAYCEDAYVVEKISPTESVVYTRTDLPFPLRDRWVVSRSQWQQDPDTYQVSMRGRAVDREMSGEQSGVRVTDSRFSWQLTPMESGDIRIVNQTFLDPNTPIPSWLAQSFMFNGPLTTMQNFQDMIERPQYRNADVPFIDSPPD